MLSHGWPDMQGQEALDTDAKVRARHVCRREGIR